MIMRIGIIGFGRIGALHAGWIQDAAGCEVALVSDPTEARRGLARRQGIRAVDSINALLTDSTIDAVLVATPNSFHFEHTMAALSAGKHVMVEKPMALDLAQARRMIDAAQQRSRALSVFHNRRWDIDFLTVKQSIDSGVFGRVFNVESRLGQWESCVGPAAKEWNPTWRNEAAFGGGGLLDWGSHFLDQLWQLMLPAKPTRVFAQLRGNVWSKDCDDFARVIVDFDTGATGLIEVNTTTTRPLPRWHIDGTLGSAFSPFSPEYDTEVWASLRFTPADGSASRTLAKAPAGLSESEMWARFSEACRGVSEPAVTAGSALTTMKMLDAARTSSARGVAVQLEADSAF